MRQPLRGHVFAKDLVIYAPILFLSRFLTRFSKKYKTAIQVSSLRSSCQGGLKYWNVGILGSGKLREWDVGKINLTRLATN